MNVAPASIQKPKIGSCPHGLPAGACPICSGMGGGGSMKKDKPVVPEMSWDECYAVWQQMLADKALKAKNLALQEQIHAQNFNFSGRLNNLAFKIASFADKITAFSLNVKNNLPKIVSIPILIATKIFVGVLNVLKEVFSISQKVINAVQQRIADISDKLNAIFGELKNSLEKKISDGFKNMKKKFKSFFGIFEPADVDNEEQKVEKTKRMFDLKTTMQRITRRIFKGKDLENNDISD